MTQEERNPLEFWDREREHCQSLIKSASTPRELKAYQKSLDRAERQIKAIEDGTYQAPSVEVRVLKKGSNSDRTNQEFST